jgi:hypothetical protein
MVTRLRLVSGTLHNLRCEHATAKLCRCGCNGVWHGSKAHRDELMPGEKTMSIDDGGEVAEFLKNIDGKRFECHGVCGNTILTATTTSFHAYPHDGGLADKDGKRWWLSIQCPNCDYETSYGHIASRIDLSTEVA